MTFQTRTVLFTIILLSGLFLVHCGAMETGYTPSPAPVSSAMPADPTPINSTDIETEIDILLARYGWTVDQQISRHTVTLPDSFQHHPGDFPYAIYWAYNNEFNRDIGLDLVPWLGHTVQASTFLLKETLPESFYPYTKAYAVVVVSDQKIIGAWIDRGRHYGFACSLDRKNFNEITDQEWSEWLVSAGVVDRNDELERQLAQKTPEEIIGLYYQAKDEGDYQLLYAVRSRRSLAGDLFSNKDEQDLFNQHADPILSRALEKIESVHLVDIEELDSAGNCLPVYAVSVDFRFEDPAGYTSPEGTNLRFVVLNEEIEGLGWRIEEVNTSPGVSDRLCPP